MVDLSARIRSDEIFVYSGNIRRCKQLEEIDKFRDRRVDGTFTGREAKSYFNEWVDDEDIPTWTKDIRFCSNLETAARAALTPKAPPVEPPPPEAILHEIVLDMGQPNAPASERLLLAPQLTPFPPWPTINFVNRHADLLAGAAILISCLAVAFACVIAHQSRYLLLTQEMVKTVVAPAPRRMLKIPRKELERLTRIAMEEAPTVAAPAAGATKVTVVVPLFSGQPGTSAPFRYPEIRAALLMRASRMEGAHQFTTDNLDARFVSRWLRQLIHHFEGETALANLPELRIRRVS